MSEASDAIEAAGIAGIARVSVDGTTTEAMTIADQILAAEYAKTQAAASKNHLGLTFRTLKPGGCG